MVVRRAVFAVVFLAALLWPQAPTMTVTLTQQVDVFQTPATSYALTKTPVPTMPVQVWLNGLLLCGPCGKDYVTTGSNLTFTGQLAGQMAAPVVQVSYWVWAQK